MKHSPKFATKLYFLQNAFVIVISIAVLYCVVLKNASASFAPWLEAHEICVHVDICILFMYIYFPSKRKYDYINKTVLNN